MQIAPQISILYLHLPRKSKRIIAMQSMRVTQDLRHAEEIILHIYGSYAQDYNSGYETTTPQRGIQLLQTPPYTHFCYPSI